MLPLADLVGLIRSLSSFASIKSAFGMVEEVELFGSGEMRDDGLRLDFSSGPNFGASFEAVEASVADIDVLGVTREISILVVEDTDERSAFGWPPLDGSIGVAESETVEKRFSSSTSVASASPSSSTGTTGVGESAVGDNNASIVGLEIADVV